MISEDKLETLWRDFDHYSEHSMCNQLCPQCMYPTRTCHACGEIMHNEEYEAETDDGDSVFMIWWLCESCGFQHTEESNKKVRR